MVAERLDNKKWRSVVFITRNDIHIRSSAFTFYNSKTLYFRKVGGVSTGTNRFVTGFHGLTTMPREFQKVMDIFWLDLEKYLSLLMTFH